MTKARIDTWIQRPDRLAKTVLVVFLAALNVFAILPAGAETIGLSLPVSGNAAELGARFQLGAKLAMEESGTGHTLYIADDGCEPELAKLAADDLAKQNPAIVTGLLCNDAAIAAATKFAGPGIPVLVAGARSIRLIKDRRREEWNLWRMAPGDDYPAQTAARTIEAGWKTRPYAIVDDGTIYGRNFADTLRLLLEEAGLPPQYSDTFRAAQSTQAGLVRRLQRSGVTAVFIAAAATEDLVTIGKNLNELDVSLEMMATEPLAALPFLEGAETLKEGLMVVAEPRPDILAGTKSLTEILMKRQTAPDALIYSGYAAIEVALAAIGKTPAETTANLRTKRFETILGPVEFNPDGSNLVNPYKVYVWNGVTLVPHKGYPEKNVEIQ